jgi:Sulfotransferase family
MGGHQPLAYNSLDGQRSPSTFGAWRADKPRPVCERPIFDAAKLASMRERYLQMAGAKKLVIKNPFNLARLDMLKAMFPDALFVFSVRAPWPTIQSATVKGNTAFLVPTEFVNSLPDSLILRAAATWAESIDVLMRERDANWFVVRHEELAARPRAVIAELYRRVGIAEAPPAHAARLPETRARDCAFIKYQMMRHPYRAEIFSFLEERARAVGYDANLSALPGSGLRYAAETWLGQLRQAKQPRAHPKKTSLLARA